MSHSAAPQHAQPSLSGAFRMIRVLGTVSLLCGLFIAGAHLVTFNRIRHNQETIMRESVAQLLPGIRKQLIYGILPSGDLTILGGVEGEGPRLFAGYDGSGNFLGVVIEASGRGYADIITAMYAYSPQRQAITGFKVVDMKETPGLGDRIGSDPDFAHNFDNLDVASAPGGAIAHPITVVKHGTKKNPWEIDALSGATISSRAVGRMLEQSIRTVAPVITRNLDRIERGK